LGKRKTRGAEVGQNPIRPATLALMDNVFLQNGLDTNKLSGLDKNLNSEPLAKLPSTAY
jgi:hypothetical protein